MPTATKKRATTRVHQGEPILAVPSPWYTVAGLIEGEGWYELYQAKTESEQRRYFNITLESDDESLDRFDDFAMLPPEVEHTIAPDAKGQHRSWLESCSPATAAARRRAGIENESERGTTRPRRKRS
jgi:hypothetical protein